MANLVDSSCKSGYRNDLDFRHSTDLSIIILRKQFSFFTQDKNELRIFYFLNSTT